MSVWNQKSGWSPPKDHEPTHDQSIGLSDIKLTAMHVGVQGTASSSSARATAQDDAVSQHSGSGGSDDHLLFLIAQKASVQAQAADNEVAILRKMDAAELEASRLKEMASDEEITAARAASSA